MSKPMHIGDQYNYDLFDVSTGEFVGSIDKPEDRSDPDAEVIVTLPCGHKERFFRHDFTDEMYIEYAKKLKKL